jgi:hypothetical protein
MPQEYHELHVPTRESSLVKKTSRALWAELYMGFVPRWFKKRVPKAIPMGTLEMIAWLSPCLEAGLASAAWVTTNDLTGAAANYVAMGSTYLFVDAFYQLYDRVQNPMDSGTGKGAATLAIDALTYPLHLALQKRPDQEHDVG